MGQQGLGVQLSSALQQGLFGLALNATLQSPEHLSSGMPKQQRHA